MAVRYRVVMAHAHHRVIGLDRGIGDFLVSLKVLSRAVASQIPSRTLTRAKLRELTAPLNDDFQLLRPGHCTLQKGTKPPLILSCTAFVRCDERPCTEIHVNMTIAVSKRRWKLRKHETTFEDRGACGCCDEVEYE
jgi:hypothetical protein